MDRFPHRVPDYQSSISDLDWGDVTYLNDNLATLTFQNGRPLRVYGCPLTPEFGAWAFQYPAITDVWTRRIPDDSDVVVVHGPPALHHDGEREHKGDGYLLRELRRVKPRLVVFGHIHDGYGVGELSHDGAQGAYEDIVLRRSGLVAILRMCFWVEVEWFRFLLGLSGPKTTTLVNADIIPLQYL